MSRPKDDGPEPGLLQNFGATLTLLRRLAEKNQSEVAYAAGIAKPQLSAYELGNQFPTLKTFDRLLKALQVTPVGFFYTLFRVDCVAADLRKSGRLRSGPLFDETGDEGDEAYQRVVGDLVKLIRAGRRRRGEAERGK